MAARLFDLARWGDAIAAIDAETGFRMTYRELLRESESFAMRLDAPGKRQVFMFADNTLSFLVAYHAVLQSGHAVCLLDTKTTADRREALEQLYRPTFLVEAGAVRQLPSAGPSLHPDLTLLLSTSGSTGSAKLVRLSAEAVASNAASIVDALAIDHRCRAITTLAPSYSFGLSVLNSHAMAGATVVMSSYGILTKDLWASIERYQCTSFSGVPFAYEALLKLRMDERAPTSIRVMTQAGGKLAAATALRFHAALTRRGGAFVVMYGQTEATARMSCLPSAELPSRPESCGKAIARGRFLIDAGVGDAGEVVYQGPNVMMGYAESPEDLARGDELHGELRTGDLGRLDSDGFLTLTGRLKRMVKIHGSRLSLDEVEAAVRRHTEAAVVGRDDRIVLVCVDSMTNAELARMAVARALHIDDDALEVRSVSALPRTSSGKTDYGKLEEWMLA